MLSFKSFIHSGGIHSPAGMGRFLPLIRRPRDLLQCPLSLLVWWVYYIDCDCAHEPIFTMGLLWIVFHLSLSLNVKFSSKIFGYCLAMAVQGSLDMNFLLCDL